MNDHFDKLIIETKKLKTKRHGITQRAPAEDDQPDVSGVDCPACA
jgi:hypothetical protein